MCYETRQQTNVLEQQKKSPCQIEVNLCPKQRFIKMFAKLS